MKKIAIAAIVGIVTLSLTSGVFAQVKPEDQIKFRKAAYSFSAWNMGKIKANLEGAYNAEQVKAAAEAVAAVANSGLGALFSPGTEKAIGEQKTAVKPELFQKTPEVVKLAGDFAAAANELVKAAESGDAAAVKAAHGKVSATCKACHDDFKTR
ncbi:MAG: cytochrome c [Betaproteobacteria bacterium]|nr:cytochrome c [Betaproteobacteria bacterium]